MLRCDCERTGAATPYTPVRRLLHQVLGTSSAWTRMLSPTVSRIA